MSRISRLAGPALWLGLARPAFAQIPAWVPPEPPAAATEPLVTPAHRAPRAAPVETPAPAKTALITEQHGAPPPGSEAREEPAPPAPPHPQWYGWQTLAADAATVAIFVTAAAAGNRGGSDKVAAPLATVGVLSYEFAPGIVHFAHRHPGRGFASFGIRLGLPLVGVFLGAAAASGCDGFLCEAGGAGVGALVGVGGAIAIDAAVFAYDDPRPAETRAASLLPTLAITRERAMLGLAGTL